MVVRPSIDSQRPRTFNCFKNFKVRMTRKKMMVMVKSKMKMKLIVIKRKSKKSLKTSRTMAPMKMKRCTGVVRSLRARQLKRERTVKERS